MISYRAVAWRNRWRNAVAESEVKGKMKQGKKRKGKKGKKKEGERRGEASQGLGRRCFGDEEMSNCRV